jgi:hypothetical protein
MAFGDVNAEARLGLLARLQHRLKTHRSAGLRISRNRLCKLLMNFTRWVNRKD